MRFHVCIILQFGIMLPVAGLEGEHIMDWTIFKAIVDWFATLMYNYEIFGQFAFHS